MSRVIPVLPFNFFFLNKQHKLFSPSYYKILKGIYWFINSTIRILQQQTLIIILSRQAKRILHPPTQGTYKNMCENKISHYTRAIRILWSHPRQYIKLIIVCQNQ